MAVWQIKTLGMFQMGLTIVREVWRAQPSAKNSNLTLVSPDRKVGAAETETCLNESGRSPSVMRYSGGRSFYP
jgi:hypothetical protein